MNTALLLLAALFILIYGGLGLVAIRRPLLTRLATREALRRPLQSALLVIGLMIAGASILTALVLADSVEASLTGSIYREWGRADVIVTANGRPFSPRVANRLAGDGSLRSEATGVQAGLELTTSVADLDRQLNKSAVRVVGFDTSTQQAFGSYVLRDGRRTSGADLPSGSVLLSQNLADALAAQVGDRLLLIAPADAEAKSLTVTVAGIATASGPGGYGVTATVFAPLGTAQQLMGGDQINVVRIAAKGDGDAEVANAHQLIPDVQRVVSGLGDASGLAVREPKATQIESQVRSNSGFSLYVGLSVLVIIAAAIVAVNLAIAVADERRPQLGILRALGLTRRGMVLTAVLEGALYSLVAGALSLIPGVLAPGLIVQQFNFPASGLPEAQFPLSLVIESHTLAVGVITGSIITLLTLLAASWHTSRMTMVAAIRNLPDPPPVRRGSVLRMSGLAVLTVAAIAAIATRNPDLRLLGGAALIAAVVSLARRFLPDRLRATLLGAALAAWALTCAVVFGLNFVLPMVVEIAGLCLLTVANLRLLEKLLTGVGRTGGRRGAILRPPLAYLCRRPVRTGLATAAFSIVLTVIVMLGVAEASQAAYLSHALAWDLKLSAPGTQPVTLSPDIESQVNRQTTIQTRIYSGSLDERGNSTENSLFRLYAFTDDQLRRPPIPLLQRDRGFANDAAVWQALRANPGLVVSNVAGIGVITLAGDHAPVRLRVIGQQLPGALAGMIGSERAFVDFQGRPGETTVLLKMRSGSDPPAVAGQIQRSSLPRPVGVSPATEGIAAWLQGSHGWIMSLDVLIALGLVSGVLTIGIVALRAVIERRHASGVLRALGYQRHHLVGGLLAEAGLTTSTGVLIGLVSGALLGVVLARQIDSEGATLLMDWGTVGVTLALIYATLIMVTSIPAMQMSRLAPAQALRLLE